MVLRPWLGALVLAGLVVAVGAPAQADTTVTAELSESNDSGVTGSAELTATSDGGLRVVIHASGLVADQPHAQHIHGSSRVSTTSCARRWRPTPTATGC